MELKIIKLCWQGGVIKRCIFPGPGPGAYQLPTTVGFPSHDPSRNRNPMYSFGASAGFQLKGLGPGPAYRIDRVTRDGNVTSPAWSFGAKYLPFPLALIYL